VYVSACLKSRLIICEGRKNKTIFYLALKQVFTIALRHKSNIKIPT